MQFKLYWTKRKKKYICLSCQGVDIYWDSLLINYVYQEIIYAAEEMASCNWSPTSGEPGATLVRLEWHKSEAWPVGADFFLPVCHISLLRNLLPEQALVKVFSVSCPSLSWINILLRNRFVMKICYLSAFISNEERYA